MNDKSNQIGLVVRFVFLVSSFTKIILWNMLSLILYELHNQGTLVLNLCFIVEKKKKSQQIDFDQDSLYQDSFLWQICIRITKQWRAEIKRTNKNHFTFLTIWKHFNMHDGLATKAPFSTLIITCSSLSCAVLLVPFAPFGWSTNHRKKKRKKKLKHLNTITMTFLHFEH